MKITSHHLTILLASLIVIAVIVLAATDSTAPTPQLMDNRPTF